MPSLLTATYLGHATVLLEMDGARLLTDPLLRDRVAHLRRHGPSVDVASLRPVDAVLLSHLHQDHCDLPSLRRLGTHTRIIAPAGAGPFLRRRGFKRVQGVAPGDAIKVRGVTVRATPAVHVGRRFPLGPDAGAIGFLVEGSRHVYFAGDTDLFDGMADISSHLHLALLPIWGWGTGVGPGHLDPRRGAKAVRLLRPAVAVPIHWGDLRMIGLRRPASALFEIPELFAQEARLLAPMARVVILPPGDSYSPALAAANGAP